MSKPFGDKPYFWQAAFMKRYYFAFMTPFIIVTTGLIAGRSIAVSKAVVPRT